MALPTDTRQLTTLLTFTLDAKIRRLTDNFFNSNPLIQRLYQRAGDGETTIRFEGGTEIKSSILYAGQPTDFYGRGSTFPTSFQEIATDLQFRWGQSYAAMNIYGRDIRANAGSEVQWDNWVEVQAKNAINSLFDRLGYGLYGTDPSTQSFNGSMGSKPLAGGIVNSLAWDGLYNAISDGTSTNPNYYNSAFASYGGIANRGSNPFGNALKSYINTTGGPFSMGMVQDAYGRASVSNDRPDLIVTSQVIWNRWWDRSQASERNQPGPMRDVGFDTIRFNGAEVVVDSHVPGLYSGTPDTFTSGSIFILNTKYIELWIDPQADFIRRGSSFGPTGFPVFNQDAFVDQIICDGNLVVPGPRYQAAIFNVT